MSEWSNNCMLSLMKIDKRLSLLSFVFLKHTKMDCFENGHRGNWPKRSITQINRDLHESCM